MANLAMSGFYTDVHLTDGTNALGDTATRPLYIAPINTSVTLQASTVFSTGTTTGTTTTGLGGYKECLGMIRCTAVTGSPTAKVYLQVTGDAGTTWTDYLVSENITAAGTQWFSFHSYGTSVPPWDVEDAAAPIDTNMDGPFGDRIRVKVVVTGGATDATIIVTGYFKA